MPDKQIVEAGYDQIAESFAEWTSRQRIAEREHYEQILIQALPFGATVLELGCGAGLPTTRLLAERFVVTGVDLSQRSIELARQNVPNAAFLHADMTALEFPPASFDGIAAFYSLFHVPRAEQPDLLIKIASWLRPGGILVATMGAWDQEALVMPWLGTEMFWSFFDSATNRRLIEQTGLQIDQAQEETAEEDGQAITFLWIVAHKPA